MNSRGAWRVQVNQLVESLEKSPTASKFEITGSGEDRNAAIIAKYFTKTKKEEEEAVRLLSSPFPPTHHNHPIWALKYVPVGEWPRNSEGKRMAPEGSSVVPVNGLKRRAHFR